MDIRDYGFEPQRVEVLDSSRIKDFVDCPSMFYLRHILGLVPTVIDPQYETRYTWGSAWHRLLHVYYREGEDIVKALEALEEIFPSYVTPDQDKYKRGKERMIKAFFDYLEKWKSKLDGIEILRHEQFFDVYSEKDDLRWCGRIDSVRRRIKTGSIVPWDYKTSSVMGPMYFDQHEVGFQFPGYVWATDQMMGGEGEVKEITIDVMYMISKTVELRQKTFRYDSARIKEWVRNVKWWIAIIMRLQDEHLYDPEAWGKNWNECTRYGRCQYFDVHSITPRGYARMNILRHSYKIDRWDPLDSG